MSDDPRFIAPGFFLLRQIPKRLGIIALNSSLCNGKLSSSVPPIQSKFLARNLSSLTRWRSCLYELVLRAANGAGLVLVRCCSISFARNPSARSCFQIQANFKRLSTGSFILIQGFCPLAPKSNSPPIQNLCTHPSFRKGLSNNGHDSLLLNNKVSIPTCIANCREMRSVNQFTVS